GHRAFLARRTPGLNRTSLGARSTRHGKVSCLYLTASPQGCPEARCWDHFSLPFTPPRWALSSAHMVFPISYADDTQLFLSFPPEDTTVSARISDCHADISTWMKNHHLQLNLAKTELMVFPAKQAIHHNIS